MAGGAAIEVSTDSNSVYLIALADPDPKKRTRCFVDELVYTDFKEAVAAAAEAQEGGWEAHVVEVLLDPDNFGLIPLGLMDGALADEGDQNG